MNVKVVFSGPVFSFPAVPLLPLQPPEAVHEVAFVEAQVKAADAPGATDVGLALSVTVGCGGGAVPTVTTTLRLVEPPVPVQLKVNVLVVVNAGVGSLPEVARAPDHAPLAVQLVAFVDDHVSVLV